MRIEDLQARIQFEPVDRQQAFVDQVTVNITNSDYIVVEVRRET